MSAYLSPILSSGDSTPIENLISAQSCAPLIRDENEASKEIDFPAREFRQHQENRQQQTSAGLNKQHIQQTPPETDRRKKTSRQKSRLAENSTSEEELSDQDDSDNLNDEDDFQSDRLKFTAANQQNYQKRYKSAANKISDTSTQPQFHKPHQCLADQFLSMTSSGKNEQNSTRSSSFVCSESELLNGNDLSCNNSNRDNNGEKLRNLFRSAAGNRQRINKKLGQILRSIPLVPLVATTSIMTIILLSLLLLSDTLHLATASYSHNAIESEGQKFQQQQQQQHTAVDGNMDQRQHGRPQMQSLVMGPRTGQLDAGQRDLVQAKPIVALEEFKMDDGTALETMQPDRPGGLPTRTLNLRRELVGSLFAQRQHQRHHHHHNHHQLQQKQQPIGLKQPEHKLSRHASEKRHSSGLPEAEERGRELNLAGEQDQQQQVGENQVGLFDSLGAMLFGVGANQRQQQQQVQSAAEDNSQLALPELGDDERAVPEPEFAGTGQEDEEAKDERRHAGFVLDGAPHVSPAMAFSHRPAHLLSSALELDLSPDQQQQQQQQQNPNKQQPVRTRVANPHSRQQQHVGKHPHRQSESPMLDRQQQQQTGESTMASNNHERKFDVPQIHCNNTDEGFERFACPTPDSMGRFRCIEDVLFCDGYKDCPGGEDEDRTSCMYYRLFVSHIDILTNTFLTWMKSQTRQAANDINSNQNGNNQHHHRQQALHLVGGEQED